jgi:hypothetical protein
MTLARFRRNPLSPFLCFLSSTLKTEASGYSEAHFTTYRITRRYNQNDISKSYHSYCLSNRDVTAYSPPHSFSLFAYSKLCVFPHSTSPLTRWLRQTVTQNSGRAIAQAVSRRLPTAAARVRYQFRSCGICGGYSGSVVGFIGVLRFHGMLHTNISSRGGTKVSVALRISS